MQSEKAKEKNTEKTCDTLELAASSQEIAESSSSSFNNNSNIRKSILKQCSDFTTPEDCSTPFYHKERKISFNYVPSIINIVCLKQFNKNNTYKPGGTTCSAWT